MSGQLNVRWAKPGPNRPSQAGPYWRLHGGFCPACFLEKPKPSRQAFKPWLFSEQYLNIPNIFIFSILYLFYYTLYLLLGSTSHASQPLFIPPSTPTRICRTTATTIRVVNRDASHPKWLQCWITIEKMIAAAAGLDTMAYVFLFSLFILY
jgi:hypothetical protein